MVDESIGDLMELWEVGEGGGFHVLGSQMCPCEIRRTFPAQRIDPALFHLQMEKEPIGASAITEGLQRSNLGVSQRHTIYWQGEHLAMPFKDIEALRS
jgi:hypothetical protein